MVLSVEPGEDPCADYINANYVDGYKQKNAFISTQGPLPRTFGDFWRMVWEQQCVVIVMTTRCLERNRAKCGQYWPNHEKEAAEYGYFEVVNLNVELQSDYLISMLHLTNLKVFYEGYSELILTGLSIRKWWKKRSNFLSANFHHDCKQGPI